MAWSAVPAALALAGFQWLSLSAPAAAAQPQCFPRAAVLDRLAERYGEHPVSIGVTATGALLEVYASADGSWTIVVTAPGGASCLVASGEGWRGAPRDAGADPEA